MMLVIEVLSGFFFFFQAEDGIRDVAVTGVQTCALPISEAADEKGGDCGLVEMPLHATGAPELIVGRVLEKSDTGGEFVDAIALGGGCEDRKSTRLNSSHGYISYAVFCLKKKKVLLNYKSISYNLSLWMGRYPRLN